MTPHASPEPRRAGTAVVLLLVIAWLAATSWARPLTLPDEGRYVGVALEMLRTGNWLTPTLDGLPYFHKPPLFYWITGASLAVFGINEWAARIASLLGAVAAAMSLLLFVRRWSGERCARGSLLVLLTQPFFFIAAQFANLDMLVAGCITVTILLLAHAVLSADGSRSARPALMAAYLTGALGMLAKGLIGLVLPALVIVLWLTMTRRLRLLQHLLWLPGALVLVLVAAPWFVAMQLRFPDFLDYFFVVQHFKRFAQGGFNNVQPFWFFPVVLCGLTLPWALWLLRGVRRDPSEPNEGSSVRLLMWIWLFVVLLFFSLPRSKLIGYVLPALPPLAYLIVDGSAALRHRSSRARWWWHASAVVAAITCVAVAIALAIDHPETAGDVARSLGDQRVPGEAVVFIDRYFFDAAFYSGTPLLPVVVGDWENPAATQRDNWRKELFDAGRFAPVRARQTLLGHAALPAALCGTHITWVMAAPDAPSRYPFLTQANLVASNAHVTLWRVDSRRSDAVTAIPCSEMPNDGSSDK